ncbi:MAG: FeoB-associated Cys-rich membrane protein [Acutalibacteraceae bacterium]|nr:FeoB-associated Cys-rich membrane protein [Acutalibacteraceae bacterium]
MFDWLVNNSGTIIIALVLAVIVALIIIRMIKNKKNGKLGCGCGCSSCAMKDACHADRKQ